MGVYSIGGGRGSSIGGGVGSSLESVAGRRRTSFEGPRMFRGRLACGDVVWLVFEVLVLDGGGGDDFGKGGEYGKLERV